MCMQVGEPYLRTTFVVAVVNIGNAPDFANCPRAYRPIVLRCSLYPRGIFANGSVLISPSVFDCNSLLNSAYQYLCVVRMYARPSKKYPRIQRQKQTQTNPKEGGRSRTAESHNERDIGSGKVVCEAVLSLVEHWSSSVDAIIGTCIYTYTLYPRSKTTGGRITRIA